MKITQLLTEQSEFVLGPYYHCGPKFEKFDLAFMGRGENNHLLGHGIYFINNTYIAKGYAKYVQTGDAVLYEVNLRATPEDFYCNARKATESQVERYNQLAKELGYATWNDVPFRHSVMKYGRGLPGVVFERFGPHRGCEILRNHSILGQFEEVDDGVFEVAVYDTSIIQITNTTSVDSHTIS